MKWHKLDRQQSKDILHQIASVADPSLFSVSCSEVTFMPLPFYENYMVYRVTNYATLPSFSLDFLSDGETFFLLDGSSSPIDIVNARGSLLLNENNVIDYVDFYLSNIRGDDGDIYMIRDVQSLPFLGSLDLDQQMELKTKHEKPEVILDEVSGNIIVLSDLFYDGTLLKAGIMVNHIGEMEIQPRDMIMGVNNAPAQDGGGMPA